MPTQVVVLQIDDSSDKTIVGQQTYDRTNGGILVAPFGTSFPTSPVADEFFWRSDQNILYFRDSTNSFWVTAGAAPSGVAGGDLDGYYPNPDVVDLTILNEQQGSLLYFDGTNWVSLDPSSDGYVLTTHDVGFDPTWEESGLSGIDGILLVKPSSTTRYSTIAGAITDAVAGDNIWLGPGSYSESFTLPNNVSLWGSAGTVITGALATGTRITVGDGCQLLSLSIDLPTDGVPAVLYSGSSSVSLTRIIFNGQGGTGIGLRKSGGATGSITMTACFYISGTADAFVEVTSGAVVMVGCQVQFGTLTDALRVTGGVLVTEAFLMGSVATVTDGVEISGGTFIASTTTFEEPTNAVHITTNGATVQLKASRLNGATFDLLVDPAVTTGVLQMTAVEMSDNKISIPGIYAENANIVLTFQDQDLTFNVDSAFKIWGELSVGHPELGSEFIAGEGDSYVRGMVVLTSDGTATSTTEGGNITDESAAAASPSASTFSFQGVTANHTIMLGSSLADSVDTLKHFGTKINTTTGGVPVTLTDRPFVFEIWDGAAWVEIGAMSTHSSLFHRYGNRHLIRSSSSEHIRYGIDETATWVSKTINGDDLYWSRIRIATTVTTAPVFERMKLSPNRFEANEDGTNTYHGRARFRQTIQGVGNVFGESGGVTNWAFPVGSGGLPTGWNQIIKNSELNGNGDAIYLQFVMPRGIDTSFPMSFKAIYIPDAAGLNDVDLIFSMKPLEVTGTLVADTGGSITPVARTLANTVATTVNTGLSDSRTIDSTDATKVQSVTFGPFSFQDYYEGDLVVIRLEMDDDGIGNADIGIISIEIDAVKWTHGEKL